MYYYGIWHYCARGLINAVNKSTANKNNHNGWMFLFGTCKAPPGSEYEYALKNIPKHMLI